MNLDLIRQHAVTVKDVVDIHINENQQIIRFGRVGRVKFKKAVPAIVIMMLAIVYGVWNFSVEAIIVTIVIIGLVCWYLIGMLRDVSVDLNRKKLSNVLFNITLNEFSFDEYRGALVYSLTLNGRQPTPKEFCVKFRHNGKRNEIHLADLLSETEDASRENFKHVAEIWKLIVDYMQITDYDTEYQMSARNAIFA